MLKRADWRALQEAPDASKPGQLRFSFCEVTHHKKDHKH